jgi:hypothetical protein
MRKIFFVFVCSFIALGWVGCEPKPGPNPEPDPEPDTGVPTITPFFWMDSVRSCCGMDSFAVKTPWVQREINRFMADTALDMTSTLTIDYITDENGDYYLIEQYSWDINRLCDCSGNILKEVDGYNVLLENPGVNVTTYGRIVVITRGREGL